VCAPLEARCFSHTRPLACRAAQYRNAGGSRVSSSRGVGLLLRRMTALEGAHMDSARSAEEIPRFIATHGLNPADFAEPVESCARARAGCLWVSCICISCCVRILRRTGPYSSCLLRV
jgi:hypothetical protein